MIILADQCVNQDTITALKANGFKIVSCRQINLSTASDSDIFNYARENNYILLTFDRDFGNILRFDIKSSAGVVIIYIEDMGKGEIIKNTVNLFKKFPPSKLRRKLFITERDKTRIWPK